MVTVVVSICSFIIIISCLLFTLLLTVTQIIGGTTVLTLILSILLVALQLFLSKVMLINTLASIKHMRNVKNKKIATSK